MGGGYINFEDLAARTTERAAATKPADVFVQNTVHEKMAPAGMKARECVASDDHPNPVPIAFILDTTGSMLGVPYQLARHELPRMLSRLTQMASTGPHTPQICYGGVADVFDETPFQVGQFEADNRMDNWLTQLHIGGGGGPEHMHEAYTLALYFLGYKTSCDIHKQPGGKGIAFITGDEMCPGTLSRQVVQKVFGDNIPKDLTTADLLRTVQERWHLFFLYVDTGSYHNSGQTIFSSWETLLGQNAIWLDGQATGLPEVVSALIGTALGTFSVNDVPRDLREIGCEEPIIAAVAKALKVSAGDAPQGTSAAATKRTRGPTKL